MLMKKSSDTIGNRTLDLPACNAVPQATALPRDPVGEWSENFSASIIDGNNIRKIFFFKVGTSVTSIHVKFQVIL